ncbi:MAG TPA: glycoside hydrolase family 16 protein [Trebonia sp.]
MGIRKVRGAGPVVAALAVVTGLAACGSSGSAALRAGPAPSARAPVYSLAPGTVRSSATRRAPSSSSGSETGTGASPSTAPSSPRDDLPGYVARLGSGWKTLLGATFTGSRLDTSLWGTCYPWKSADGCTNFGNSEYEWYVPSQDQVSGGALRLVAQRAQTPGRAQDGGAKTYSYRSGMITTYPSLRYQYGYTQIVARIPYGPGLWPALWLAASNQKWPPEIDILEHSDTEAQYSEHLHSTDMSVQAATESTENLSAGWHTFGLYWSPSKVIWYIDGQRVMSASTGVPRQSMYLIANLAVNQQDPAGWEDGSALDIRSVTVWQAASYQGG